MENLKETLTRLPHESGVYIYRNSEREVLYVGKARDLSRRVKQYFQRHDAVGEKTERLVSEIVSIDHILTTSEFDALLLEAKLIKQYLPKYNVISRDDKSPLYVVITLTEELPRILLVRRDKVPQYENRNRNAVYGPFQSGFALRRLLRQLRSIVPYCIQKERHGHPCFYTHLGLCDPCPAVIVRMIGPDKKNAMRKYRHNMRLLRALFEGNTRWLATSYEKEMRSLANAGKFEKAAIVKERLNLLNGLSAYRYDPQVFIDQGAQDIYEEELAEYTDRIKEFYPNITVLSRIECFDISNLFGEQAVGSMVVLQNGRPQKSEYRKFRIKTVRGISDVAMMREVLRRRFTHTEWVFPQFLLVDGGKTQVTVAHEVLKNAGLSIPLAGLAKREEELIIPSAAGFETLRLPLSGRAIKIALRIRDEAHRFAISYHRKLREKDFRFDQVPPDLVP